MIHPLPQTEDCVSGVHVPTLDIHQVSLAVAVAALDAGNKGEYRKEIDLWDLHTELRQGIITRPLEEVMLDIS